LAIGQAIVQDKMETFWAGPVGGNIKEMPVNFLAALTGDNFFDHGLAFMHEAMTRPWGLG
jgi:hypothetical protein